MGCMFIVVPPVGTVLKAKLVRADVPSAGEKCSFTNRGSGSATKPVLPVALGLAQAVGAAGDIERKRKAFFNAWDRIQL